jgi:hypothetical protein
MTVYQEMLKLFELITMREALMFGIGMLVAGLLTIRTTNGKVAVGYGIVMIFLYVIAVFVGATDE